VVGERNIEYVHLTKEVNRMFELVNALAVNWEVAVVLSVVGIILVGLILVGVVVKTGVFNPPGDREDPRI